jgi:hypothetical protein
MAKATNPKEQPSAPLEQEPSTNGRKPNDANRPSWADFMGHPPTGGSYNTPERTLQVSKDNLNWLPEGIITEEEHEIFVVESAKGMIENKGEIDIDTLFFMLSESRRAVNHYSWGLFERIARGIANAPMNPMGWFPRMAGNADPQQQQGPPK